MEKKSTVLIAEDEQVNRLLLRRILCDTYDVAEVENGRQALDYLHQHPGGVSAVLLDLVMPDMSGYDFLKIYQASPEYKNLPLLVVTSQCEGEVERACLERGAWDFVTKPYNPEILRFRLKGAIERSMLGMVRELQHMADFDPVAQIYNKRKFFSVTRRLLDEHPTLPFVMIHFDIEKFQLINAFFGEAAGDRFIRYVAKGLTEYGNTNPLFTYGHLSGDAFVFCGPCASRELLTRSLDEARETLRSYPLDFALQPVFGVTVVEDPAMDIGRIFDQAVLASRHCKNHCVGNYAVYEESMGQEIIRAQSIVNSMDAALEQEQFQVYLQPKYDLRAERFVGAEALVRWNHPVRGMIPPGEFIPVFERNGFIMKLDCYMCEQVCRLLRRWLDEGRSPSPISFNLSRVSLFNPKLEETICALLERYRVPPRLVQLELTETVYTTNPNRVREIMDSFQHRGFSVLMDDFGSGYSSLNALKDIAVDILKIDMAFLSESRYPGRGENILASVIRMAKWLRMPVIMEGVETEEQVCFLRELGCEYIQGDYFAQPMPPEAYERIAGTHGAAPADKQDVCIDADSLWRMTDRMSFLFSGAGQAMAIYEYGEGRLELLRANSVYCRMFGYEDLDAAQKGLLGQIQPEGLPKMHRLLQGVCASRSMAECVFHRVLAGRQMRVRLRLLYLEQFGTHTLLFGMLEAEETD